MPTQTIVGSTIRNNGGVVPYGGTQAAGSPITNTSGRTIVASPTIIRTTPKDLTNTDKILSGGTFAYEGGAIYSNYTTRVAGGVSEDAFLHVAPGAAAVKPVSNIETGTFRQVPKAIRQGLWQEFSGIFASAPTVAQEDYRRDFSTVPSGGYGFTNGRIQTIIGGRTPAKQNLGPKSQW